MKDSQLTLDYDPFAEEFRFVRSDGTGMTLKDTVWWLMHRHKKTRASLARAAGIDHTGILFIVTGYKYRGTRRFSQSIAPVLRVLLALNYTITIAPGVRDGE